MKQKFVNKAKKKKKKNIHKTNILQHIFVKKTPKTKIKIK